MGKEIVNNDTPNVENADSLDGLEADALKEKLVSEREDHGKTKDTNRQLFARAKKAEGFEEKDGEWVKVEKKEEKKPEAKPEKTDYAQEAYLIANGIKDADEKELLTERMEKTGKDMKEVVEDKFFQQDIEELRREKAVKLATPSSSNRSGASTQNTVDYWKAKIDAGKATLLDIPDVKLRRDVVNSRLTKEKDVNHFTDNPFGTIDINTP